MPAKRRPDTADRILDVAERLVQVRGFNGFSYADVSHQLKIKKASLHHHFATKAELGVALIDRYHRVFFSALDALERDTEDGVERLAGYVNIYSSVLRKNRMCLCGMLAADFETLPRPMRQRVKKFFAGNEAWLARVVDEGRRDRALRFEGNAADVAQHLVSALEGAMLIARSHGEPERFDRVSQRLLHQLAAA